MEDNLKKVLRALSLELRHILEGQYDAHGQWMAGDLERRLNEIGVWRERAPKPLDELPHLSAEDKNARKVADAYIQLRDEAGVPPSDAVAEFIRESAYTWANRLFALRCMEARGIIDEVILQKAAYGGRSLVHNRFAKKNPEACSGEDEALFTVLFDEFSVLARELSTVFGPDAPATSLRPSIAALKRCIGLLSGGESMRGQAAATDEVFEAPDAFGWTYQYWNSEEKDRVFKMIRTKKGAKIEGADIISATQLYTEPYMVRFLVQNSLGALWMGMHPESRLSEKWDYFLQNADRAAAVKKRVSEITFLDPAVGSGHFLLEAFDLLYEMYEEEGVIKTAEAICASILNHNLFGIDIDERATQIATAALWMKAKEKAPDLNPDDLTDYRDHIIATNIRLPRGKGHLEAFLTKHPNDKPMRTALELVFEGLENADELGSLLQIEEPVETELLLLKEKEDAANAEPLLSGQRSMSFAAHESVLPLGTKDWGAWKEETVERLRRHFDEEAEVADLAQVFFGRSVGKALVFFDLLSKRYDIVAANPPYLGIRQMGQNVDSYVRRLYPHHNDDLYAAFLKRCNLLCKAGGVAGLVVQQGIFFTVTYRAARDDYWKTSYIECFAHVGTRGFAEITGEIVNTALLVTRQGEPLSHTLSSFVDVRQYVDKASSLRDAMRTNTVIQRSFAWLMTLPKKRLCYWFPDDVVALFMNAPLIESCFEVKQGLATTNNARFIRRWWEAPESNRYVGILMSEGTERWLAENTYLVDWEYDGKRLRSYIVETCGSESKRIYSKGFYFREGVTFGSFTAGDLAVRYLPSGFIFDHAAPCAFPAEPLPVLAFLNSQLCSYLAEGMNPTSSFQVGDMKDLPLIGTDDAELRNAAAQCIRNRRTEISLSITSPQYDGLHESHGNDVSLADYLSARNAKFINLSRSLGEVESLINERIFEAAGISEDTRKLITSTYPLRVCQEDIDERDAVEDLTTSYVLGLYNRYWSSHTSDSNRRNSLSEQDIIPFNELIDEKPLAKYVRDRFIREFPQANPIVIEREFRELVGVSLDSWLENSFFKRHISQFKNRPIVWQIRSQAITKSARKGRRAAVSSGPAFSCLLNYHRLDAGLLSKLRKYYVGELKTRYETELRTLGGVEKPSIEQSSRKIQLEEWNEELKSLERLLEEVSLTGFGPEELQSQLRQRAIDDAMLALTSRWLKRLSQTVQDGPLGSWQEGARETFLHEEFPQWIHDSVRHLDYACAVVGPKAPDQKTLSLDPSSADLAPIISRQSKKMVEGALSIACDLWWKQFDEAVLSPIRRQIKQLEGEANELAQELEGEEANVSNLRRKEITKLRKQLKAEISELKKEIRERSARAGGVRRRVESWSCQECETWGGWLASQPLYDEIASLDGKRPQPTTVSEFITQESIYAPDLNDGVRVNIAPLQMAGLLAADVLVTADLQKAIADRAEWRADERRWSREGKLSTPGWWKEKREKEEATATHLDEMRRTATDTQT